MLFFERIGPNNLTNVKFHNVCHCVPQSEVAKRFIHSSITIYVAAVATF